MSAMQAAARSGGSTRGKVFVPKGFDWDRSISAADQAAIIERVLRLPAWAGGELGTDNLDVKKLAGREFWRLRVGDFRAVFQVLGSNTVLHRVFRKKNESDYDSITSALLVRSQGGLRTLVEDMEEPPPVPQTAVPVKHPVRRDPVVNPLQVFSDAELGSVGLSADAIDALRRVPAELLPDRALKVRGVHPDLVRLVAELWERPGDFVGKELGAELVAMTENEAAERLVSDYSVMSLVAIEDAGGLLALLDANIEDWMVYLHPLQAGAARRSATGPSRVRGAAGTGKTVVALHRARFLADETGGEILLTTFVNNLPKIWDNLLASFPDQIRGKITCRTVNQLARELYLSGGGTREITDEAKRRALIREVWLPRRGQLGGLSELGLQEEFDYMIIGRSLSELDEYAALPRTGRGTPLNPAAREAVWEAYEDYSRRMARARLTFWPELKRDALTVLREGRASKSFEAVVADEAQDLGETAVHMLVEMAGGLPQPNLTLVGDGQQAIYPGGFSLLQMGIDIRGRATVLRTNWRNSYMIWQAAQAFIAGEGFDDLEEESASARDIEESPLPMREGLPPGLWLAELGQDAELAAEVVAETIAKGARAGDTAVLAPTNQRADQVRSALGAANVPAAELAKYQGVSEPVVRVGTFHRAKGLEFKHVVVIGLNEGTWPPKRPGFDPLAESEARARDVRAAFVAMTRARDRLDVVAGGKPAQRLADAAWAFDQY